MKNFIYNIKNNFKHLIYSSLIIILFVCLLMGCVRKDKKQLENVQKISLTSLDITNNNITKGDVFEGDTIYHTFYVKNTGAAPLLIKGLKTSCNCTSSIYSKKPIEPDSSISIHFKIDTRGKNGKQLITGVLISNTKNKYDKLGVYFSVDKK